MIDEQRPCRRHGAGKLLLKDSQRFVLGLLTSRSHKDLYFTREELSFKKVIHVFKLNSSGPCGTHRAY